jgi:hypothetical protein
MDETKIFETEKDKLYATGQSVYLEDKRLDTAQLLRVTHIAGSFENCATSEYVELGYYNGHAYVQLKKAAPTVAGDLIHWDGEVYLREGQYIYAYFKDVADGEKMKLRANGEWIRW